MASDVNLEALAAGGVERDPLVLYGLIKYLAKQGELSFESMRGRAGSRPRGAGQTWAEHDHEPQGATRRARSGPEAGFAVGDEELAPELYATGVPVRNEACGVVAAVNMVAHASMISLEELVDALGPHLVSTADRISARLGYRQDDER